MNWTSKGASLADGMKLLELCAIEDVSADTPIKVEAMGVQLAVFQVGENYYVTQDHCTHGPGSLSEGYLEGKEIECPFHQGRFDVTTGEPTSPPCTIRLRTWNVILRDGKILVDSAQHASSL